MEIEDYGFRGERAEVAFTTGERLLIFPELRSGEIVGVSFVAYVKDGKMEATVSREGLWSPDVSRDSIVSRLAEAIDVEREVYRLYRQKRIDESTWQERYRLFWKTTIKTHRLLSDLTQDRMALLPTPPERTRHVSI